MTRPEGYVGVHKDMNGGMTEMGKIVRDAWVFGFIPETETCEGWSADQIQSLWSKNSEEWNKYNFQVGSLPPDMLKTFMRIHDASMARARGAGWDPEKDLTDEQ